MRGLKAALLCFLFTAAAVLSGCTPYKELKELSIVEGMGVDLNPNGSYRITFQLFKPDSSGGSGGGGQTADKATVLQSEGKNLMEASRNATFQTGKKLYYSNIRSLVLSRDVCNAHFAEMLDFFARNREIMPNERVFVTPGRAEDILTAKGENGIITAEDIEKISINNYNTSEIVDQRLADLLGKVSTGVFDPALAVLQAGPKMKSTSGAGGQQSSSGAQSGSSGSDQAVQIIGTEFFHNGKPAGMLGLTATRGLLWIRGEVKGGIITVYPSAGGNAALEITDSKSETRVNNQGGKPAIEVSIRFTTKLSEYQNGKSSDVLNIEELTTLQNDAVRKEAQQAVDTAFQKGNADIFGFGRLIYQTQPQLWRTVSGGWSSNAGSTPVTIKVSSAINLVGLVS